MIRLILLISSAIIPIIILLLYFKNLNKFHQSWSKIIFVFSFGILATMAYCLYIFSNSSIKHFTNPFLDAFYISFFQAGLPEELLKFAVLIISSYSFLKLKNEIQGIIFGSTSALAFALLENILYVNHRGFFTALARAITAVPGHALLGALMGFYFYKFYSKSSIKYLLCCLIFPILLHTVYDFILIVNTNLYGNNSILAKGISQLIISAFILFVVMEFGAIVRLIITTARNQYLHEIEANPSTSKKEKLIDTINVSSDNILLHETRVYIYILTSLLSILLGQPLGIFGLMLLRDVIDTFFKPVKVHRMLKQNLHDEEEQ